MDRERELPELVAVSVLLRRLRATLIVGAAVLLAPLVMTQYLRVFEQTPWFVAVLSGVAHDAVRSVFSLGDLVWHTVVTVRGGGSIAVDAAVIKTVSYAAGYLAVAQLIGEAVYVMGRNMVIAGVLLSGMYLDVFASLLRA